MQTRTYATRLERLYGRASIDQVNRGRAWYPTAREHVDSLAKDYNVSPTRVASILAITSPRCSVEENFNRTVRALRGEPVRGFGYMDAAVMAPLAFLNGPKVRAFAKAIMGMVDSLVLDVWAIRAAGLDHERLRTPERAQLDHAYRLAARRTGETVRDFQAVVWLVAREGSNVKRRDVHSLTLATV